MDMETKQELVKLAALILEELNYLPSAIQEFEQTMVPACSNEPRGLLFKLNPEELQQVRELEETYQSLCYAVIKGHYSDSSGDISPVNYTYLTLDKNDLERYQQNILRGASPLYDILDKYSGQYHNLGYQTWAFVSAGYITEHGTVAVKPRLGGLTRTC